MTHYFYLAAAVLMSPPHALITPVTESPVEKGRRREGKGQGVCTLQSSLRMQIILPDRTKLASQPKSMVISVAGTTCLTVLIVFAFKAIDYRSSIILLSLI